MSSMCSNESACSASIRRRLLGDHLHCRVSSSTAGHVPSMSVAVAALAVVARAIVVVVLAITPLAIAMLGIALLAVALLAVELFVVTFAQLAIALLAMVLLVAQGPLEAAPARPDLVGLTPFSGHL
eukprot:TRINITY_DN14425_c0_g1_i7.p2 TRINITY_DN14425_c0_g1~~TRINITY_DN14425_c0_g1_i7.p2  ORF type:complete len:126 (-),score=8.11 TRINITY_DN14425_c0_g1_i7:267-644(-)